MSNLPIGAICKYCDTKEYYDPLTPESATGLLNVVVCETCDKRIRELITVPDPTRKILWQLIHVLGSGHNSPLSAGDTTDWLNELQEEKEEKEEGLR